MSEVTRREFLKQIAFSTGAIAVTTGVGRVDLTSAAPVAQERISDETTFLEGVVSRVENNILVIGNDPLVSALFISDQTRLWKGKVTSVDQVEPGDHIYARGLPRLDGGFTATKVWVNIANLYGTVVDNKSSEMRLRIGPPDSESLITVHVSADTLFNEVSGIEPAAISEALSAGQLVQALGVLQKDGSLIATRIWTADCSDFE